MFSVHPNRTPVFVWDYEPFLLRRSRLTRPRIRRGTGSWLHGSGCERLTQIRGGQGEPLSGGTVREEVRTLGSPLITGRGDLAASAVLVALALHKHESEGDSDLAVAGGERLQVCGDSWHGEVPFLGVWG